MNVEERKEEGDNNNNNNLNYLLTPQKNNNIILTKKKNLYDEFSENKNSNLKKISFDELISLSTNKKERKKITNQDIINEFNNKINYYTQILHYKEAQKENFMSELVNFQKWFLSYFQKITNFDEVSFGKLKNDYEKIKLTYDTNLLSHADAFEWELFDNSINNFMEFLHDILDKVNYNVDIEKVTNDLIEQGGKMITLNDYEMYSKYQKKNYFDKKKYLSSDYNFNDKQNKKSIYEIIMMKHCGDYSETYYDSGEYEGVDEKRKKFKFLKLKIYLSKKENYSIIKESIDKNIDMFKRYLVTFKQDSKECSSQFIKIIFCGICLKNKKLKQNLLNFLTEKIQNNAVIKLIYYLTLKKTLDKTIKKLKQKENFIYYTSNFPQHYLNRN